MKKLLSAFALLLGVMPLGAAAPENAVFTESYLEWDIVSVQDLAMTMPGRLFTSVAPEEKFQVAAAYPSSLNVFILRHRSGGANALIDAGYGRAESRLLPALAQLKIKPEDISAVFITHIHPDHVGGLSAPDGAAAFPSARIYVARQEYEAWKKDPSRRALARHLAPYEGRIVRLDYDAEVAPFGLRPLHYPGHTPGHTVFKMELRTENGRQAIHFVGDIVHAAELQIPRPEFCARFDRDPETAVRSRRELLERAAVWYGAHLPFPGIRQVAPAVR